MSDTPTSTQPSDRAPFADLVVVGVLVLTLVAALATIVAAAIAHLL